MSDNGVLRLYRAEGKRVLVELTFDRRDRIDGPKPENVENREGIELDMPEDMRFNFFDDERDFGPIFEIYTQRQEVFFEAEFSTPNGSVGISSPNVTVQSFQIQRTNKEGYVEAVFRFKYFISFKH